MLISNLERLPIRWQVTLPAVIALLSISAAAALFVSFNESLISSYETDVASANKDAQRLASAEQHSERAIRNIYLRLLLVGSFADKAKLSSLSKNIHKQLANAQSSLSLFNTGTPKIEWNKQDHLLLEAAEKSFSEFFENANFALELMQTDIAMATTLVSQTAHFFAEFELDLRKLRGNNHLRWRQHLKKSTSRAQEIRHALAVTLTIGVALGGWVVWRVGREIAQPLVLISERLQNNKLADKSAAWPGAQRVDEIGVLARAMVDAQALRDRAENALQEHAKELEREVVKRTMALDEANENLRVHRDNLQRMVADQTAELVEARNRAESANRTKSEFLANMSHELRTPMHSVLSFAQIGSKRVAQNKQGTEKYFDRIVSSAERLMSLLDNLLDLSKLDAGRMTLQRAQQPIGPIVTAVLSDLKPLIEKKDLHIEFTNCCPNTCCDIDGKRILQVIYNLLTNAIAFTPNEGQITVDLAAVKLNNQHPGVVITVRDTGVGIPADEIDDIFDKFVQSSKTRSGAGGTGLGLSICKEIVEMHGGIITAKNALPKGAEFTVTLLTRMETKSTTSDNDYTSRYGI